MKPTLLKLCQKNHRKTLSRRTKQNKKKTVHGWGIANQILIKNQICSQSKGYSLFLVLLLFEDFAQVSNHWCRASAQISSTICYELKCFHPLYKTFCSYGNSYSITESKTYHIFLLAFFSTYQISVSLV